MIKLTILDHNYKPRLKSNTGFVRNSVEVCPNIYVYHDEVKIDGLIADFTESFGNYMYGRIVQVPNCNRHIFKYKINYDTTKTIEDCVYVCDIRKNIPAITPMKDSLGNILDRYNIIY